MSESPHKRPPLPKPNPKSEQDPQFDHELIVLSSDDDDLSSKVVEISTLGAYANATSRNPSSSVTQVDGQMMKTEEKNGAENAVTQGVDDTPKESDAPGETDPLEKSDDILPRKLLGKGCFIGKKGNHRAKDCPEKSNSGSQSAKICLNCGDFGHEVFSCNENKYSLDDLKEIQCYVCKCFGHLCCAKYAGERSREISCYRCGKLGHSGLECARVHAESGIKWTPSACLMCGKEAYMACKCTVKSQKRKMEQSSIRKKNKSRRKRNKKQQILSQPKPMGRGGWITENPHAYNHNLGWGSPNTPAMYMTNYGLHGGSGYQPSNHIYHVGNGYQPPIDRYHGGYGFQPYNDRFHSGNLGYNSPNFNSNQGNFQYGSAVGSNGHQHRFSASRFANSSNL